MVHIFLNANRILSCKSVDKDDIIQRISDETNLKRLDYYLVQNGRTLSNEIVDESLPIHIQLRLLGGKGGFGSMLRAIGAQIEKTTNREACRDLSGRRLRDINEEKRLKAWLEKQKDREAEAEEKKKKKVEKLLHVPKHEFKDPKYEEARSKLTEKVNDSVEEGFKKAVEKDLEKPNLKRKGQQITKANNKKSALWLGDDLSSGTDSDGSDESDCEKPSTSNKNCNKPSTSNKNV